MPRFLLSLSLAIPLAASAQAPAQSEAPGLPLDYSLTARLGAVTPRIDSTEVGTVGLAVDALAFFKDNEFDGNMVKGYSLPGFRLQPRVTYTPLPQIRLEAGLHATVYDGAGKYPAYVFHDIATWKGDQYTPGAHFLPFFRATAQMGHVTVVAGDIYGGVNHQLALPLWNPELTLTDDPEMGAQIIVDRPRWHSDVWVNWTSYIYEESTHQESFVLGWSQRIDLWRQGDKHRLYLPLQALAHHRGGEQDITNLGVQTFVNAAAGLAYQWRPGGRTTSSAPPYKAAAHPSSGSHSPLTSLSAEILYLSAWQQSGHLWPFTYGQAAWAGLSADFAVGRAQRQARHRRNGAAQGHTERQADGHGRWGDLRARAGIFRAPANFCTCYGTPFFGTVSAKYPGVSYNGITTAYLALEYGKTFAHDYTVGAKADAYLSQSRTPFSFGVYLRANPTFILKRLKP